MSYSLPSVSVALPAVLVALSNPPRPGRMYYTCEPLKGTNWRCEKARGAGVSENRVWVDICKFQPDAWHKEAIAKKLFAKPEDILISEKPRME